MNYKTKILIVDDEPLNLDFFEVMLSNLGFTVVKAEDGEEALEKVQTTNPDLIILDNVMPKLSGWKVTRLLKTGSEYKAYKDIPIIMFSAMDDVKDKIEGFELGVEDYITKPFNFSEVLARIRAVLRHRELSRQVVRNQERISLIETLNQSYLAFGKDLESRLEEMESLKKSDDSAFPDKLSSVIEFTKKSLGVLSREYDSLQSARQDEGVESLSLRELEGKFNEHFEAWKRSQDFLNEDV